MNDILTKANLVAGIQEWKNRKPKWGFQNDLYKKLQQLEANGLNQEWWQSIIDELWNWRAIRPSSKTTVRQKGLGCLRRLDAEYDRILRTTGEQKPNLETVSWEMLSGLYEVARSIKRLKHPSPVFGSKLCHFILPNAFPVVDREMIGIGCDYGDYWNDCSTQWAACTRKQELAQYLERAIESEIKGRVTEYYPWATKVTELCITGLPAEPA